MPFLVSPVWSEHAIVGDGGAGQQVWVDAVLVQAPHHPDLDGAEASPPVRTNAVPPVLTTYALRSGHRVGRVSWRVASRCSATAASNSPKSRSATS